jgi:hypothetical protein
MKHKAPQVDINWGEPEAFALVVQSATDGERVAKEKQQREADRKANEEKQPNLI